MRWISFDEIYLSFLSWNLGYFNLTQEYLEEILHKSESEYDLLMAHPRANGFLGARGFAGGIPHAYTHIAKKFYNKIDKLGLHKRWDSFEIYCLGKKIFCQDVMVYWVKRTNCS